MAEEWEIWNVVLQRASDGGVARLSQLEQVVYRANCYFCDIQNGGLSGLLYNLSPPSGSDPSDWSELRDTATALREIGDTFSADLLTQCADRLEALPHRGQSWVELLDLAAPDGDFRRLENALMSRSNQVWGYLESFTQRHREALERI